MGFPSGSVVKNSPEEDTGDSGSTPGLGRSPGEGNGNPLQYFCLESIMDKGSWWATVHGATKSWTGLEGLTAYTHTQEIQDSYMTKIHCE